MASPEAAVTGDKRSRSRSPAREEPKPKKKFTGLKFKDKKPSGGSNGDAEKGDTGLHRGYRDRSPRKDSYRTRTPPPAEPPTKSAATTAYEDVSAAQPASDTLMSTNDKFRNYKPPKNPVLHSEAPQSSTSVEKPSKPRSDKPRKPKAVIPTGPMIVVNVNDRLGTKAAIPCLASDSVKAFKAVVAAHIGRQPHEIMIKRQGERPFKDVLTLEDYGVSSGVQLDLEIETGD
nr:hypothetical protein B0A51_09450 [Rachicladosporium sp. CCFEE 5018]